jgi:hypothetical protein
MRGTKRFGWVAACVVTLTCAAAVIGVSTATSGPSVATANSVTYEDSTGEAPGAPDITTVVVSNDDAGFVSFAVRFANRTWFGPTEGVWIDLNTDQDRATGARGFDYSVQFWEGVSSLWRWDTGAADWVLVEAPLSMTWATSTLTVRVHTNSLGSTSFFLFRVVADSDPDDPNAPWDVAPPAGMLWMYDVKVAPVLEIAGLACTPNPALKGRPMVARATVRMTRGGNPEELPATAKVKWTATIGTLRLKPTNTKIAPGGVLVSTWRLPTAVKGKSARVTLAVTVDGVTVTKTHLHRVR